jgi:beta-galactosidase
MIFMVGGAFMNRNIKGWLLFLFVVHACQFRLFGQEQISPRERWNLNAGWLFKRQDRGTGELGSFDRSTGLAARTEPRFTDASNPAYDDSEWVQVDLPHTWNAHDVSDEKPGYWRGIGWYRKHFQLAGKYSGKRVFLEFEGVNQVAEFWLNGKKLGEHKGGYTGFEFDITAFVQPGSQENVLTVKVDNLFRAAVPPTVKTDYSFYGGIYRDVWLRVSDPVYIAEVRWSTPEVAAGSALLQIVSNIANPEKKGSSLTLQQEILDPKGRVVKSLSTPVEMEPGKQTATPKCEGRMDGILLWSPETPNVYQIRSTLRDESRILDVVVDPMGFRWFRFDPQLGFLLNGKRLQIQGTNWHQSFPGMGNALPNSRHWKDMEGIKQMGVNFWRTSHYPHDIATIEASDQLGLMVWEELPINKEIGNPDEYIANALQMAEEMIRRDRNHPSVLVWGIAGEVNAPHQIALRVVREVSRKYRELDSARPVGMHAPRGEDIEELVDVVGLGVDKETDEKHLKYPNRSFLTAEYSASLMGRGIYGEGPESEELACQKHEGYLSQLNLRPWMAGGMIWHQFDYDGETYDTVIPHVVAFGMADVWRIPKEVYYFYQSQWSSQAMVHIVGHWTWLGEEGKTKPVKVYSNCDEVELFLNGRSLGKKGIENYPGLTHPPRIWQVPFQPGRLRAVASHHGKESVQEIRTAGPAHHILLESDSPQLKSGDLESLAYITASVVDKDGTVIPDSHHTLTFTSYGPGQLLPQTWLGYPTGLTWNVIAGKTRIAFRATSHIGLAVISAHSPGLGMGRLEINVGAAGKENEMDYQEKFEGDELK